MKNLIQLSLFALSVVILSGCASTSQYVAFPDQTKRIEDPDKARVYVVRPSSFGSAIPMEVRDGDKLIGELGPKGFLCWERESGKTVIRSKAENIFPFSLNTQKGMVYYLRQHAKMGILMARTKITALTEEEGKELISKAKEPKVYVIE